MASNATQLYWKLEVPEGDGETPHPADAGPAWIYRPDGSEEPARNGEWSTRADARRIADENGYELELNDGLAAASAG